MTALSPELAKRIATLIEGVAVNADEAIDGDVDL